MMDKSKSGKPIFILQTYQDRIAGKDLSQKLSERLSTLSQEGPRQAPPPPPPLPEDRSNTLKGKKGKAPPVPVKTSTLSHQPPPCPTPDYDSLSITSTASLPHNGFAAPGQEAVEMESLESFKLNSPAGGRPRPPDTYFGRPEGPRRPVSVTIGEYPSGTARRPPGRLDFLQGGGGDARPDAPVPTQLASELARTLGRSNLRKRTESMANGNK